MTPAAGVPIAHGGTVGLITEIGGVLAILAVWGWVWWRSRGVDGDDELR